MCLEAGRPVALSSDAHCPSISATGTSGRWSWLRGLGVTELAVFERPRAAPGAARMSARTGIGYDSHRLEDGRPLVLGGVEIPDAERGLAGHSDADVLTHAVIDALLGAAGLGDIGQHFPDTDERWRDADSIALLARCAASSPSTAGPSPPRRHRDLRGAQARRRTATPMRERAGRARSAWRRCEVNVKFTTNEGMGFVGRGEGIAALAVATLRRLQDG